MLLIDAVPGHGPSHCDEDAGGAAARNVRSGWLRSNQHPKYVSTSLPATVVIERAFGSSCCVFMSAGVFVLVAEFQLIRSDAKHGMVTHSRLPCWSASTPSSGIL